MAAGCNQLYGLDQTVPEPPDGDRDGIDDTADNCPSVTNPEQADTDLDGFGDACDGCADLATERNHDEDGDGRGDDCDACPTAPDFGDDMDGDSVPNPCDPGAGVTAPIAFDPFLEVDAPWATTGTPWQATGDSIAPIAQLADDDPGLRAESIEIAGVEWFVDIGISARERWQPGTRFGVGIVDPNGQLVSCEVRCMPDCTFAVRTDQPAAGNGEARPVPQTIMHLESRPQIDGHLINCRLEGSGNLVTGTTLGAGGIPVIYGSPDVRVRYFAAWSNTP